MKVALIGSKAYDSLEYHIADAFVHLGHDVFHVDMSDFVSLKYLHNYWLSKFLPGYSDKLFANLVSKVMGYHPDLVIATYRFIPASAIQKLKDNLEGVPIVQLNPDALTTFEKQQIFYSPYDFYFTKDRYIVDFMRAKLNLNAFYLPEAFSSFVHTRPERKRFELENEIGIDLVAFGTMYPYRLNMLSKIVDAGINVSLFGSKFTRFFDNRLSKSFRNEFITGKRKSEVLYGSKIVFNNFHYAEIESVNCKFFEIFGIGAFQICDYKPVIDEYSAVDSSKFTFKSTDEAIDLIKYYLSDSDSRYELANHQYEHFMKNHTYVHRVNQMLQIIFK